MKGMCRGRRVKQSTGTGRSARKKSGMPMGESRKGRAPAGKDPSSGQTRYINHTIPDGRTN
jgi:hypothetical protein